MNTLSLWLERSTPDSRSLFGHLKYSENAGMWSQVSGNWESAWNLVCLSISPFKCHIQVVILPPFPPWFFVVSSSFHFGRDREWNFCRNTDFSPLTHPFSPIDHITWFSPIPRSSIISLGFLFNILVVSIQMWRKDLWGFVQVWSLLPALGYGAVY